MAREKIINDIEKMNSITSKRYRSGAANLSGMPINELDYLNADGAFRFDLDSTAEKYYQNHPEETSQGFRFDVYSTPESYDKTYGTGGNSFYDSLASIFKPNQTGGNSGGGISDYFGYIIPKKEELPLPSVKNNSSSGSLGNTSSNNDVRKQLIEAGEKGKSPTGSAAGVKNTLGNLVQSFGNATAQLLAGNAAGGSNNKTPNKKQSGAGAGNEVIPNEPNSGATPNTGLIIGLSVGIGLITVSGIIYFATRKK